MGEQYRNCRKVKLRYSNTKMPTAEEVMSQMSGATVFNKLNAIHAGYFLIHHLVALSLKGFFLVPVLPAECPVSAFRKYWRVLRKFAR